MRWSLGRFFSVTLQNSFYLPINRSHRCSALRPADFTIWRSFLLLTSISVSSYSLKSDFFHFIQRTILYNAETLNSLFMHCKFIIAAPTIKLVGTYTAHCRAMTVRTTNHFAHTSFSFRITCFSKLIPPCAGNWEHYNSVSFYFLSISVYRIFIPSIVFTNLFHFMPKKIFVTFFYFYKIRTKKYDVNMR